MNTIVLYQHDLQIKQPHRSFDHALQTTHKSIFYYGVGSNWQHIICLCFFKLLQITVKKK